MEKLERCLHQGSKSIKLPKEILNGKPNCYDCKYDSENNPKCPRYCGIKIIGFEVNGKNSKNI